METKKKKEREKHECDKLGTVRLESETSVFNTSIYVLNTFFISWIYVSLVLEDLFVFLKAVF